MIRAAVIGAGGIARQHLGCLTQLAGVRVVGVADLSPTMAEMTAERFGVEAWFTDYQEMIERTWPDVVHVVTPAATHFELATAALERGCHVVVEKPIASTPAELEALLATAEARGRMVVEDHNYLFNGTMRKLLEMVASGEVGEVVHAEVGMALDILGEGSVFADENVRHPSLSGPGGAIGDFLPHLAYLAVALVGETTGGDASVRSVWLKREADSPLPSDEMRAVVEGERGTVTLIFSAHAQPDAFWVRVLGTQMRAEAHLFEPRLTVERVHDGFKPLTPLRNGFSVAGAEVKAAVAGLGRKLSGGPGAYEGLWALIERTYAAVRDRGGAAPISHDQMRRTMKLVAALTAGERDSTADGTGNGRDDFRAAEDVVGGGVGSGGGAGRAAR